MHHEKRPDSPAQAPPLPQAASAPPPADRPAGGGADDDREASFRLLFAHNPHPMWVYDRETLTFLEVNTAAVLRYGYSREEFLRMRIADIRPPEEVSRLLKNVAQRRPEFESSGRWRHR